MAVVLASLLDLAGIPQDQDDEVTQDLFNKYWKNELEDPETSQRVKAANSCRSSYLMISYLHNYVLIYPYFLGIDVPIKFLGCFDMVGALGVPHTGILKFLKWTPKIMKSLEFNNTILPSSSLLPLFLLHLY